MDKETSGLKPYSLGIVVETKPRGTDYILVSPIEVLNIQDQGSIKDSKKEFEGTTKSLDSVSFDTKHESKSYIRAKWLPYGESNRSSAPDVKANETVILYKFADVDDYFWCDLMREPELRRLEDVLYSYSNKPSGTDAFDKDSSYFIRYNTYDKFIHLHTSNNDGEHCKYDIMIDAKNGSINIEDSKGNSLKFNSKEDSLVATFNKDITLNAATNINLNAGAALNINASSIVESCSSKTQSAGSTKISQSGNTVEIETPNLSTKTNSTINDTPSTTFTGSVTASSISS